jgi:hypothetical protein
MSQTMRNMVRCADHQYAPAGIICVHLANGTGKEWVSVATGPESEHDYVCADCADKLDQVPVDDLLVACIHCIRRLKEGEKPSK